MNKQNIKKGPTCQGKALKNNTINIKDFKGNIKPAELFDFYFDKILVQGIKIDGEGWIIGRQVCEALGIVNHKDSLRTLPDDEKSKVGLTDLSSNGTVQYRYHSIVNEPGFYRLVFRSKKEEAEEFKKWAFHELFPRLRRGEIPVSPQPQNQALPSTKDIFSYMFPDEKSIALKAAVATVKLIKIGSEDVLDKITRYYEGGLTYSEMSKLFNVSESTVNRWVGLCCDAGILTRRKEVFK